MNTSSKDPFEELKKNSEKRNKKLRTAGKTISFLGLALFFGVGIFAVKELVASLEWYRSSGILIIILFFSFPSIVIYKKTKGIEKYSTSSILIELLITVFMFISIYIFYSLTSKV